MKRGFTLLELSIVVALSGLMVGFVLKTSQASNAADCYATTQTQIYSINGALNAFVRKNDRYPMPAQRNIGVNDPNYGREALATKITGANGTSWGALPFQALGLPTSFAGDCWGNKFTYAVTTALTTNATSGGYLDASVNGTIQVVKTIDAGGPVYSSTTAAYAIISHGEDKFGAVANNFSDASPNWCTGSASLKSYNCLANSNTIANGLFNNGKDAGTAYFDDVVISGDRAKVLMAPCTLPWGGSLVSGGSTPAYLEAAPSGACTAQVRSCTDGVLSGSYQYASCTPNAVGAPCDLPWGGTINNGQSITAWHAPNYEWWCPGTGHGQACPAVMSCYSETRTCSNGTLSGSYQYSGCGDV